MKKLLLAVLCLAPLAFAADAPQHPFPDDYKPQPCAPQDICTAVKPSEFGPIAKLRGYTLPQEWVNAHWDELLSLMHPLCAKVANCQTVPGNHWVWCKDILADEFPASCSTKYTNPVDQERCRYFSVVFFLGQDDRARLAHPTAQECGTTARAGQAERTFEHWMQPATLPVNFDGKVTFYAIDSETRIPVMVHLSIDSNRFSPTDTIDGTPLTGYPQRYKLALRKSPRADGHNDFVAPTVTLKADGYRTETFTLPIAKSAMVLEMSPKTLKRGKNSVTITAKDSVTGKAVDARVMGNDRVLGKTNVPFEVEWKKGEDAPEIWVTSLYNIYDDVVMLPAKK
ncbi:MAG TPA: hypothetical protein VHW00_25845 [Thermoanaerobaculia bacterium]|nr:hypothetical protein [Thermoanaerobaculia bacterium]